MFDVVLYIASGFLLGCGFMWWMAYLAAWWWERELRRRREEGQGA